MVYDKRLGWKLGVHQYGGVMGSVCCATSLMFPAPRTADRGWESDGDELTSG